MSDEQDKPTEKQTEPEAQGPKGGERLAAARRAQQISVLEVAKELHLDEHKVRALERNDFDVLGAPVFAKGHLRKYAQLVGVDEDDLFADYYQLTRQDAPPPIIVGRRRVQQELSPGPWIAVIIVIIVTAAAYWWFVVYSNNPPAPETTPEAAPAQQESVGAQRPAQRPAQSSALANVAPPEPEPQAEEIEPEPEPEPSPPLDDGQAALVLRFSGDCWTEISDATGRRLYFDMGRAGQNITLTGVAPFAVLFGNVDNVEVTINGRDYALSASNPGSRMARLSIANR